MHTAETLEHALVLAKELGYEIRHDWLGGNGGGGCILRGRKLLLIDLALGTADQLEQVVGALRHDPEAPKLPMPPELRGLLAPVASKPERKPELLYPPVPLSPPIFTEWGRIGVSQSALAKT